MLFNFTVLSTDAFKSFFIKSTVIKFSSKEDLNKTPKHFNNGSRITYKKVLNEKPFLNPLALITSGYLRETCLPLILPRINAKFSRLYITEIMRSIFKATPNLSELMFSFF